jgi:predicted site-specific integrase-resolvase
MVHNRRMKYGYARISTIDQNADMQLKALQRAGCKPDKIFKDERSGATTKRPSVLRCLKALQDGDTLIVWKLDRLARSLRDLSNGGRLQHPELTSEAAKPIQACPARQGPVSARNR